MHSRRMRPAVLLLRRSGRNWSRCTVVEQPSPGPGLGLPGLERTPRCRHGERRTSRADGCRTRPRTGAGRVRRRRGSGRCSRPGTRPGRDVWDQRTPGRTGRRRLLWLSMWHLPSRLRPGDRSDRAPAIRSNQATPRLLGKPRCRSVRIGWLTGSWFWRSVLARPPSRRAPDSAGVAAVAVGCVAVPGRDAG